MGRGDGKTEAIDFEIVRHGFADADDWAEAAARAPQAMIEELLRFDMKLQIGERQDSCLEYLLAKRKRLFELAAEHEELELRLDTTLHFLHERFLRDTPEANGNTQSLAEWLDWSLGVLGLDGENIPTDDLVHDGDLTTLKTMGAAAIANEILAFESADPDPHDAAQDMLAFLRVEAHKSRKEELGHIAGRRLKRHSAGRREKLELLFAPDLAAEMLKQNWPSQQAFENAFVETLGFIGIGEIAEDRAILEAHLAANLYPAVVGPYCAKAKELTEFDGSKTGLSGAFALAEHEILTERYATLVRTWERNYPTLAFGS